MARRSVNAKDLDLVPIMNLVTILIPFLLLSASFVSLSSIDSALPAIGPMPETLDETPPPALHLSLVVSPEGYALAAAVPWDLDENETHLRRAGGPATPASWPTERLTEVLRRIKDDHPAEHTIIVSPTVEVPYEVLIATLDATRGPRDAELFPNVTVAGGIL